MADTAARTGQEQGSARLIAGGHQNILAVIASEAKQSSIGRKEWIAASLRASH